MSETIIILSLSGTYNNIAKISAEFQSNIEATSLQVHFWSLAYNKGKIKFGKWSNYQSYALLLSFVMQEGHPYY